MDTIEKLRIDVKPFTGEGVVVATTFHCLPSDSKNTSRRPKFIDKIHSWLL